MTLWTTNTWGAAHQNAAVFMRNRGPLARAPQRVMRRKRKAVVTHTVCGATAEDGAASPPDRAQPPLPSPLTHLSPLQGQCSTKFLSPPPFLCLSGPDYIPVATWGLNPWFDHSSAPTHLSEGGKERRVDRDPGILICCSSRTQASGLPSPHCFCVVSPPPPCPSTHPPPPRDLGTLVPVSSLCSHCQIACPGSSYLGSLHSA